MIWIVGNKGMLGSELTRLLCKQGMPNIGSDREVDFLNPAAIEEFALRNAVTAIVNCAAYTAVDKAEDEPELCARLNIEGPVNLAMLAKKLSVRLVHISTDYVFSGDAKEPYQEDAPMDPKGTYGCTKAEGEKRIINLYPNAIILRTAWLYGEFGSNFVYTMLKLMRKRSEIGVVADQVGSPTWAQDLARAITAILDHPENPGGIYQFTDSGEISWHEFALQIHALGRKFGILERDCTIDPLTTDQYPTKAKRPFYSVLSKEKIIRDFHVVVPLWDASLEQFLIETAWNKEALAMRIE